MNLKEARRRLRKGLPLVDDEPEETPKPLPLRSENTILKRCPDCNATMGREYRTDKHGMRYIVWVCVPCRKETNLSHRVELDKAWERLR